MNNHLIATIVSTGILALSALVSHWVGNPKPFLTTGCAIAIFIVIVFPPGDPPIHP